MTRAGLATRRRPRRPGSSRAVDGHLLYGASGGALELFEVHPQGKRPMDAEAWIRGYGDRLGG